MPDKTRCALDRRTVLGVTGLGGTCAPQGHDGPAPPGEGPAATPGPPGPPLPTGMAPAGPRDASLSVSTPTAGAHTWSSTAALKMAPSMGRSAGERGRLERPRNLATRPLVPAWASLSTTECGRCLATASEASGSGRPGGSQVLGCPGGDGWCRRA